MIFGPKLGEQVRLHYRCRQMPLHGRCGTIVAVRHGPGPRNIGVLIDGTVYCVPRGNVKRYGNVNVKKD